MNHQRVRVSKRFTFDMAHALYGHDGPCKNIHGHTYHLTITIMGQIQEGTDNPKNGMVIDFTEFKNIIKEKVLDVYDHALVLNGNSAHATLPGLETNFEKVIYTHFQPTCENLLLDILKKIEFSFPSSLIIWAIRLDETPTSYAEWYSVDN